MTEAEEIVRELVAARRAWEFECDFCRVEIPTEHLLGDVEDFAALPHEKHCLWMRAWRWIHPT